MDKPNSSPEPLAFLHADDKHLVASILAGDEDAWHSFVQRYSDLIRKVLRRYLFDDDEIQTAYVDILVALSRNNLKTYRGRSSLSTWLILIARNAAADSIRYQFGRRELPRGLRRLEPKIQAVYRYFYIKGLTFHQTQSALARIGIDLTEEDLLDALHVIDEKVTAKTWRRIQYELASESVGAVSGRLLEYCDFKQDGALSDQTKDDPLNQLITSEAARRAKKILNDLNQLSEQEKTIVKLRFEHGRTAGQISDEMGFSGPRKVFTMIDRIVRKLRAKTKPTATEFPVPAPAPQIRAELPVPIAMFERKAK